MSTDTLRTLKKWFDSWYYVTIGEFKIAKWRMYTPSFYYNPVMNTLDCKFYDCSVTHKSLSKTHLLDIWLNNHPPYGKQWLALAGFTIWFPYTWEQIKTKVNEYIADPDIEAYLAINDKIDNELKTLKETADNLILHANDAVTTLKKSGYPTKAKTLALYTEILANHPLIKEENENV